MTLPEFARKVQPLASEIERRRYMLAWHHKTKEPRYSNAAVSRSKSFVKRYLAAAGLESWDDLREQMLSWCPELARSDLQFAHELRIMMTYSTIPGFTTHQTRLIIDYVFPVTTAYAKLAA